MAEPPSSVTRLRIPRSARSPNEREPGELNWRRGLFRLWILASSAWMMGWAVYLIIWIVRSGSWKLGDLLAIPVLLFGPPIALLIFGVATAWAFRGFSPDKKSSE